MTETTTQKLSLEKRDCLAKAAHLIEGSLTFSDTPSGFDYWYNTCIKLYELSGNASPFGTLYKSTPGKFGKGDPDAEGSGYYGEIGSWKKFDLAAGYIANMNWMKTSSGSDYWSDVYLRITSFADLAKKKSKNKLVAGIAKGQEEAVKKETKKAGQPGPKLDPMSLCSCGHAYHAHSERRGCKFRTKDGCFKFVSGGMVVKLVEPLAVLQSKPEDFLEL